MGPDEDLSLQLALSLHRELNGLTRRSRQPSRSSYESALLNLKKRRHPEEKPSTTSSGGSGSKRRSAGSGRGEEESKDPHRLKQLKSLGDTSSDGEFGAS